MDKALEAGVLFQEIENELDKLIDIEADQDNCRRTPEKKDAIDCVRRQLPNPPGLPWRKTGCAVAAIKLSITAKVCSLIPSYYQGNCKELPLQHLGNIFSLPSIFALKRTNGKDDSSEKIKYIYHVADN